GGQRPQDGRRTQCRPGRPGPAEELAAVHQPTVPAVGPEEVDAGGRAQPVVVVAAPVVVVVPPVTFDRFSGLAGGCTRTFSPYRLNVRVPTSPPFLAVAFITYLGPVAATYNVVVAVDDPPLLVVCSGMVWWPSTVVAAPFVGWAAPGGSSPVVIREMPKNWAKDLNWVFVVDVVTHRWPILFATAVPPALAQNLWLA